MRFVLPGLFFFLPILLCAQDGYICEVKQYEGTDSAHAIVARTMTYNSRGQLITEKFQGWKDSKEESTPDGLYTYFYNDTVLTGWKYGSDTGDSSRVEFQYDANGKLIRQSTFQWKLLEGGGTRRVMTPDGMREEPMRRWEQTSLITYSYDDKGRKILYDATRLHYSPLNMYRWEYDEQGRIASHTSYTRGRITWKEDYQYFDWGYRYWRTWYDFEGNLRHEAGEENPSYYPLLFYTCTRDKQGRITEESVSNEKQKLQKRTATYYNKEGRITKTICYNSENKPAVTHIYVYR